MWREGDRVVKKGGGLGEGWKKRRGGGGGVGIKGGMKVRESWEGGGGRGCRERIGGSARADFVGWGSGREQKRVQREATMW